MYSLLKCGKSTEPDIEHAVDHLAETFAGETGHGLRFGRIGEGAHDAVLNELNARAENHAQIPGVGILIGGGIGVTNALMIGQRFKPWPFHGDARRGEHADDHDGRFAGHIALRLLGLIQNAGERGQRGG